MHQDVLGIGEGGVYIRIEWGSDSRKILPKSDHVGER